MNAKNVPYGNGPWNVLTQETVFENPWLEVKAHDVTHPDGSAGHYGVVHFKNYAIGVLPIDEDGNTWLVGQHRFPLNRYSWELPEGGGPIGDAPLDSAKRELAEETGFTAAHFLPLVEFDISNSVTDEQAFCYLAWQLTPGRAAPEASEALQLKKVPFSVLLQDVISGQIRDSLTIIMVMNAYIKASKGFLPDDVANLLLKSEA